MSKINIQYPTDCDIGDSRAIVKRMLKALEDKYGIAHNFDNQDSCSLQGSGVNGNLKILHSSIDIYAKLGFFMIPFKTVIENEIVSKLDEYFAQA